MQFLVKKDEATDKEVKNAVKDEAEDKASEVKKDKVSKK